MKISFNENNHTKQAAWVALGSLFSFGFGIVSSVILSRFLIKQDYGTYKQVIFVYTTLLAVFTLGLPRAYSFFIPRVRPEEVNNLIDKINYLLFGLGAIFSTLLFIFSKEIALFLSNPDLEFALKIFSPVPCLMLPTMGLEGVLASFKMNRYMAFYTILTRLIMLLCVIIPVLLFSAGYVGALIGFLISSIFSFAIALVLKNLPTKGLKHKPTDVSYKEIMQFSFPLLIASLSGIISTSADQVFISRYFGTSEFAVFSNGWMDLPFVGMITGACAAVLSPLFSKLSHNTSGNGLSEIVPTWDNVIKKSVLLIYPILFYCVVFPDALMIFFYGSQYTASSSFFLLKCLTYFFAVIMFGPLLINTGHVNFYRNTLFFTTIGQIVSQYIAVSLISTPISIAVLSVIWTILRAIIMLAFISHLFHTPIKKLFPIYVTVKISFFSLLILTTLRLFTINIFNNQFITILVSGCIFFTIYFFYAKHSKIGYEDIITSLKS